MKVLTLALALTLASCAAHKNAMESTKAGAEASPAVVAKVAEKAAGAITCTKAKDIRTILKRDGKTGGCEVAYTVHGKEKVIATARHDKGYCAKVAEKTKANLLSDHYTCE